MRLHFVILVFWDEIEILKIISRGRARKNEADSRREFPGLRILADLWFPYMIVESIYNVPCLPRMLISSESTKARRLTQQRASPLSSERSSLLGQNQNLFLWGENVKTFYEFYLEVKLFRMVVHKPVTLTNQDQVTTIHRKDQDLYKLAQVGSAASLLSSWSTGGWPSSIFLLWFLTKLKLLWSIIKVIW